MPRRTSSCLIRLLWLALAGAALFAGAIWGYFTFLSPRVMTWGATPEEVTAAWPGDEYVPTTERLSTRAITIQAPVQQVWPWIVQMGADTGGFYSYTWLEGLMFCPIVNADHIYPEWQNPLPGDQMALCPDAEMPPPYEVIDVRPGQAFILGHRATASDPLPEGAWLESWAFIVQPLDADTTRLLIRNRTAVELSWMKAIEPGQFIMEYGQMHGIQARAEGHAIDPSSEMLLRVIFAGLMVMMMIVRRTYTGPNEARVTRTQTVAGEQAWIGLVTVTLALSYFYPLTNLLDFAHLALPGWLRWLGAALIVAGLGLFTAAHRALGAYWSMTLEVRAGQPVIEAGPYRWIRHPLYAALFLIGAGMSLLSANLLAGPPYLLGLAVFYLRRVQAEEQMMIEQFGPGYKEYMKRTGRLMPKMF
jgi:protein-S-isoprenylcysteine O-methyltransferase Ste14